MKIAARRRLAVGVLATASAVVAGGLVAPALADEGGLRITPQGAFNTSVTTITYTTDDTDLRLGGTATYTLSDGRGATFTAQIGQSATTNQSSGSEDFRDEGTGLYSDGPADAGLYDVRVEDANPLTGPDAFATCTGCFTVLPAGPLSIDSVAPSSLKPGASGNVSIVGNNFARGTRVEVLLPGSTQPDPAIDANQEPRTSNGTPVRDGITTRTELERRLTVGDTPAGPRDVRVRNLDGSTALCEDCFFVAGPDLTSVSPTTAAANDPGTSVRLTFNGTDIRVGTPRLEFQGDPQATSRRNLDIEGTNVKYSADRTSVTATFAIGNAAPGEYQPVNEGTDGVVNACQPGCRFTVLQSEDRQPTLKSLDRSTLAGIQKQLEQGTSATFVATGTNFSKGATLLFAPSSGLTVTGVQFLSPERLDVTVAATSDAAVGDRDVTVRLTDGKQSAACDNCLTVVAKSTSSPSPSPSPAPGNDAFALARFSGADRYATAASIATGTYTSATTVLLANGESDDPSTTQDESNFPDALAGAYLAGFRGGPTLLTEEDRVPDATKKALVDLGADNVTVLGGEAAVSAAVVAELEAEGYTVTRVAGVDRFDTAVKIAGTAPLSYVGEDANGDRTAIVASGMGFADALVAGPLAYGAKFPILLTAQADLPDRTAQALTDLQIDHVLIPGGFAAVSAEVEAEIAAKGITTQRFDGSNRSQTAVLVASYAYDSLGFDKTHVDLALGLRFPDALAGGPSAGVRRAPILLTASVDSIGTSTDGFLRARSGSLQRGDIFGGFAAVSQAAEDQAERAVREGTPTTTTSPSPSPSPSAS